MCCFSAIDKIGFSRLLFSIRYHTKRILQFLRKNRRRFRTFCHGAFALFRLKLICCGSALQHPLQYLLQHKKGGELREIYKCQPRQEKNIPYGDPVHHYRCNLRSVWDHADRCILPGKMNRAEAFLAMNCLPAQEAPLRAERRFPFHRRDLSIISV